MKMSGFVMLNIASRTIMKIAVCVCVQSLPWSISSPMNIIYSICISRKINILSTKLLTYYRTQKEELAGSSKIDEKIEAEGHGV